jgi:excisionase family DNA binding protein
MTGRVVRSWNRVWMAAALCCVLTVTTSAASQIPESCRPVLTLDEAADLLRVDVTELERLAAEGRVPGRRVGSVWRFSCAALMAWLSGDEEQPPPLPMSLTESGMTDVKGRGTSAPQDATRQPPGTPASPDTSTDTTPAGDSQTTPIGEDPGERSAEDVFLRAQRVLLGRGDVVIDVGQFYSRRDDLQLAAAEAVGVGLATAEQRALTTFLVGRVGIFHETELFASTAFTSQNSRLFLGGTTLASSERSAFGAASIGVRRTLLREGAGRPDVVFTLSGRVPKDGAPGAVSGGLTLVKSLDPVVMFANANYQYAFETKTGSRIGPVDAVDVTMGYGLGLNDTVAISMAVAGLFTGKTTIDGIAARQPSVFSARFGLTAWLAEGLYVEPSVSFGLSGPGDGFAVGVTLPYAF